MSVSEREGLSSMAVHLERQINPVVHSLIFVDAWWWGWLISSLLDVMNLSKQTLNCIGSRHQ
jgi:hypothetical protein